MWVVLVNDRLAPGARSKGPPMCPKWSSSRLVLRVRLPVLVTANEYVTGTLAPAHIEVGVTNFSTARVQADATTWAVAVSLATTFPWKLPVAVTTFVVVTLIMEVAVND